MTTWYIGTQFHLARDSRKTTQMNTRYIHADGIGRIGADSYAATSQQAGWLLVKQYQHLAGLMDVSLWQGKIQQIQYQTLSFIARPGLVAFVVKWILISIVGFGFLLYLFNLIKVEENTRYSHSFRFASLCIATLFL